MVNIFKLSLNTIKINVNIRNVEEVIELQGISKAIINN